MKILVLVSGKAGSGKDTVGEYLVEKFGFRRYAFADRLKEIAREVGWNGEKDEKGRRLLQELGSVVRRYDLDIWVNIVLDEIKKNNGKKVVITDCRYVNEYQKAKEFAEEFGYLFVPLKITGREYDLPEELKTHESESEIDQIPGIEIENNATLASLYRQIDIVLAMALKKEKSFIVR